jgi:uncharacterized protein YbaA (DUF1428 family)
MSKYIDGFVLSVPKKNLTAYRKMSQAMGKLMKKHGALEHIEAVGDDLYPDMMGMKIRRFPQMVKNKPDEVILFSYIVFKSKAHRDKVNKMVMADPSMDDPKIKDIKMPFDMGRMAYGGFKTIVDIRNNK